MPKELKLPECPEVDKMSKVSDESQSIGTFLDWITEQGIILGKPHEHTDPACYEYGTVVLKEGEKRRYGSEDLFEAKYTDEKRVNCGYREGQLVPIRGGFEKLLARYFDIDLVKVEKERSALLDAIRKQSTKGGVE